MLTLIRKLTLKAAELVLVAACLPVYCVAVFAHDGDCRFAKCFDTSVKNVFLSW
jgi:hypothetical protein